VPGAGRQTDPGVREDPGQSRQRDGRDPDSAASANPRPPPRQDTGRARGRGRLSAWERRPQVQPERLPIPRRPIPAAIISAGIARNPADAMPKWPASLPGRARPAERALTAGTRVSASGRGAGNSKHGNNQVVGARRQPRALAGGLPGFARTEATGRPRVDWQNLMRQLTPLRRQWDLAILSNLAAEGDGTRPADLIKTINAQAPYGRRISWGVLENRLRRLEASGYIARQEMTHRPRETRYWLLPPAARLIAALGLLETWLNQHEPGNGQCPPPADGAGAALARP
jgi:DNA-binding HxlR family transcriptional regulator